MWDLTVDTLHTFYVVAGDTPVLVHNAGGADPVVRGQQGTAMLVQQLEDKGYTVLGTEISAVAANGVKVRFDVVASKDGAISVYDSKNGPSAGFTKNQGSRGGYDSIESGGGTFYGPNAEKAGLSGVEFGPTPVYIKGFNGSPYC